MVYNFLNWPLLPGSSLVVVGIANVMDLPERLSPRVTSRLGITMERMIFMAYTYQQIREILEGEGREGREGRVGREGGSSHCHILALGLSLLSLSLTHIPYYPVLPPRPQGG